MTREMSYSFSGPIPAPHVLGLYNEVLPGSAERLLAAFESQQSHRQSLETKVVDSGIKRAWYGLWCALAVSLAGIGVSGIAVVY